MSVPLQPKIYHICHVDRLPSIVQDGHLWCDTEVARRASPGTTIGMNAIKQRRMRELTLSNHPDLYVGDCVPFYFCPRSVMLYLIYRANHPELSYRDGQGSIVHLEADLLATVTWADTQRRRWAFTLSNAGTRYFEDRVSLTQLGEIDWNAIQARDWRNLREGKQAEFLLEQSFPWHLVERIGVPSGDTHRQTMDALLARKHRPLVEVRTDWYY